MKTEIERNVERESVHETHVWGVQGHTHTHTHTQTHTVHSKHTRLYQAFACRQGQGVYKAKTAEMDK
jgi:hypothetical protein